MTYMPLEILTIIYPMMLIIIYSITLSLASSSSCSLTNNVSWIGQVGDKGREWRPEGCDMWDVSKIGCWLANHG